MNNSTFRSRTLATLMTSWLCLSVSIATARAVTIDTTPGNGYVGTFGDLNQETFGQTFVAPDTLLTSFSFTLKVAATLDLQFFVMDWNGSRADGPVLYQSAPVTVGVTGADQTLSFSPNLGLIAGNDYVAFLSVSLLSGAPSGSASMLLRSGDAYANGTFAGSNNGSDFSALTTTAWDSGSTSDAAFTAHFTSAPLASPVPEAGSTLPLLGFALAGIAAVRLRVRE